MLAAKVLVHCRNQLSSDEEVTRLWNSASLEWSALGVASDRLGEFLSSHVSQEVNLSDSPEHMHLYSLCLISTGFPIALVSLFFSFSDTYAHTHKHIHIGSYLPSR